MYTYIHICIIINVILYNILNINEIDLTNIVKLYYYVNNLYNNIIFIYILYTC